MAYYTLQEAREALKRKQHQQSIRQATLKPALEMLNEAVASARDDDHFDIFLSHCLKDAEEVASALALLEEQGHKVYVDWVIDKNLNREHVTPGTADILRKRMRQSDALFFATSVNSPDSRWMPWELGYFDGLRKGRIAVMPLLPSSNSSFKGQEYLGLYPVVEQLTLERSGMRSYVTRGLGTRTYIEVGSFRKGVDTFNTY